MKHLYEIDGKVMIGGKKPSLKELKCAWTSDKFQKALSAWRESLVECENVEKADNGSFGFINVVPTNDGMHPNKHGRFLMWISVKAKSGQPVETDPNNSAVVIKTL